MKSKNILCLAALVIGLSAGRSVAESYFSATGSFSSESSTADFFVNFTDAASDFAELRTFAHDGGTNNAGDLIPSGGIDSYLELYDSSGLIASNDDRQTGKFDSLIGGVRDPGSYRLRMETTPFGGGLYNGAWAADTWLDGNFTLTNITGTGSTLATLKIASTSPGGMVFDPVGALSLSGLLEVRSGAVLNVQTSPLRVGDVATSGDGKIDLNGANMIIDYTGSSPVASVQSQLHSGGIVSTGLSAGHVLGVGEAAALGLTTFEGQPVDSTTLIVKATFGGDANLDGKVDVTDLGALATNWQTSAPWGGGDFNYDGFIDVTDLGILATNWQAGVSGSPLGPQSLEQALAALGLPSASVPEPDLSFLLLCLTSLVWISRGRLR